MNKKVIVVCGPTGSGKSELALKIAQAFSGELINADSRQIYKHLDIGTNKDIKTDVKKYIDINLDNINDLFVQLSADYYVWNDIPTYLLSFLKPDESFNVYKYKKLALNFIDLVFSKRKLPIIVGGTGLYIDSIVKDYIMPGSNPDVLLRKKFVGKTIRELQASLRKRNSRILEDMNNSDRNNPRRLIRAIEKTFGKEKSSYSKSKYEFLIIYPKYSWGSLITKLDLRVDEMIKNGLINEVQNVLDLGFMNNSVALNGIGYRDAIMYLEKKVSLEKCVENIKISHRQYARRQRTWFEGKGRNYKLIKVSNTSLENTIRRLL